LKVYRELLPAIPAIGDLEPIAAAV